MKVSKRVVMVLALVMAGASGAAAEPAVSQSAGVTAAERDEAAGDRLYQRALRYLKRRNYTKALEMFEAALPYRATDANIYFNMVAVATPLKAWRKVVLYGAGFLYLETEPSEDRTGLEKAVRRATRMLRVKPRAVVFDMEPKGTEVRLGLVPVGRAKGGSVLVPPGDYEVRAVRPDYEPLAQKVTIAAGEGVQKVTLAMVKKVYFGALEVATDPADGVTVVIDGKLIGTTPLKAPLKLETRRYLVKFTKPGYDMWQRYVTIEKDQTATLKPVLEKSRP